MKTFEEISNFADSETKKITEDRETVLNYIPKGVIKIFTATKEIFSIGLMNEIEEGERKAVEVHKYHLVIGMKANLCDSAHPVWAGPGFSPGEY